MYASINDRQKHTLAGAASAKHFQKRSVSSAAAEQTVTPSGGLRQVQHPRHVPRHLGHLQPCESPVSEHLALPHTLGRHCESYPLTPLMAAWERHTLHHIKS